MSAAAPALGPADVTGFRIMRETEIAPAWWGKPTEVGETVSATVADRFCREQNTVTMNPNRSKRIQFWAEPITAPTVDVPQIVAAPAARLRTPAARCL
ncbi:hypothetical protein ACIRD6_35605 [Streptomyces sp. NPDC102473]|uniref:hypothetical protein n=1 Tax=Streptomyces sp. NPDC102473 TaxID=3366180 RepID=UPI00381F8143